MNESTPTTSVAEAADIDSCCQSCKAVGEFDRCAKCKAVRYCSRKCQVDNWPHHKYNCGADLQELTKKAQNYVHTLSGNDKFISILGAVLVHRAAEIRPSLSKNINNIHKKITEQTSNLGYFRVFISATGVPTNPPIEVTTTNTTPPPTPSNHLLLYAAAAYVSGSMPDVQSTSPSNAVIFHAEINCKVGEKYFLQHIGISAKVAADGYKNVIGGDLPVEQLSKMADAGLEFNLAEGQLSIVVDDKAYAL